MDDHMSAWGELTTVVSRAPTRMNTVIELYTDMVGSTGEPDELNLIDLLADLMHWADTKQAEDSEEPLDFDACVERARVHYTEERSTAPQ